MQNDLVANIGIKNEMLKTYALALGSYIKLFKQLFIRDEQGVLYDEMPRSILRQFIIDTMMQIIYGNVFIYRLIEQRDLVNTSREELDRISMHLERAISDIVSINAEMLKYTIDTLFMPIDLYKSLLAELNERKREVERNTILFMK